VAAAVIWARGHAPTLVARPRVHTPASGSGRSRDAGVDLSPHCLQNTFNGLDQAIRGKVEETQHGIADLHKPTALYGRRVTVEYLLKTVGEPGENDAAIWIAAELDFELLLALNVRLQLLAEAMAEPIKHPVASSAGCHTTCPGDLRLEGAIGPLAAGSFSAVRSVDRYLCRNEFACLLKGMDAQRVPEHVRKNPSNFASNNWCASSQRALNSAEGFGNLLDLRAASTSSLCG